jgi:hypothetical protein
MKFELINNELSEAVLYRSSRQFGALDGRTVADLLFLNTLILALMYETDELHDQAMDYAKKTIMYGTFSLFRSFATDLYMLIYQTVHPSNDHVKLKDAADSKKFLNSLQFQERKFKEYLIKMSQGNLGSSESHVYLYRLETQLKITDSRYRSWRRHLIGWPRTSEDQKQRIFRYIQLEFNRLGQGTARRSELLEPIKSYAPTRIKTEPTQKSDIAPKILGTLAGAAAGRYVGGKLSGMDQKKAKNIGTGIGAIAGYWAGGRKQK